MKETKLSCIHKTHKTSQSKKFKIKKFHDPRGRLYEQWTDLAGSFDVEIEREISKGILSTRTWARTVSIVAGRLRHARRVIFKWKTWHERRTRASTGTEHDWLTNYWLRGCRAAPTEKGTASTRRRDIAGPIFRRSPSWESRGAADEWKHSTSSVARAFRANSPARRTRKRRTHDPERRTARRTNQARKLPALRRCLARSSLPDLGRPRTNMHELERRESNAFNLSGALPLNPIGCSFFLSQCCLEDCFKR